MKRIILLIILFCGIARAEQSGVCDINPEYIDDLITFDDLPYIINEENNPEFITLGDAIIYTTKKYNICDIGCADLAWSNAYNIAEGYLWDQLEFTNGEIGGEGCGGDVTCKQPVRAHNVQCTVEVGDCDLFGSTDDIPYTFFKIKKAHHLECLGDISCKYEHRKIYDCCKIVSTINWM
jgi:hypothetical protein